MTTVEKLVATCQKKGIIYVVTDERISINLGKRVWHWFVYKGKEDEHYQPLCYSNDGNLSQFEVKDYYKPMSLIDIKHILQELKLI